MPIQIYWKFSPPKNENFQTKKTLIFFHTSAQNIDCGYSLEPPHRGGSNEYPQSMSLSRNNKNNVYPCKTQVYYIKVGFKGVKIIKACFPDGISSSQLENKKTVHFLFKPSIFLFALCLIALMLLKSFPSFHNVLGLAVHLYSYFNKRFVVTERNTFLGNTRQKKVNSRFVWAEPVRLF